MDTQLDFSVDIESPISVYVQIENQVQFAIASGRLKPGDLLPSVHKMSRMLGINANTVTKSYRDLELMQFVAPRRGVGVHVTDRAPKLCQAKTRPLVLDHLKGAVAECVACGIAASEVQSVVSQAIKARVAPYRSKKGK